MQMSNVKSKATETVETAADATKKAASKVIAKSKDLVHAAGQKLQDGGKRLKDV
jgi:hypothetical protein